MKLNKSTYFSLFFLFCFIASFGINSVQNLNTIPLNNNHKHLKYQSFSHKEDKSSNSSDSLFEENQSEVEDGVNIQAYILPYFITYFQYETLKTQPIFANPLAEKLTNPIYISVCNFRI